MVHVVATIRLKAGCREAYLAEFRQVVPLVRAEAGCVEYIPTGYPLTAQTADTPDRADTIVVIEKWADLSALQAHLIAPHMTEYRGKVKSFVAEVQLQVLEPLA
jgi:quinol monooxygenase YgiN